MTFKEYFDEHKKLLEELDRIREEIKRLEEQGLAPNMEKEINPNLENYKDWHRLIEQEVEVCRRLVELRDKYEDTKGKKSTKI